MKEAGTCISLSCWFSFPMMKCCEGNGNENLISGEEILTSHAVLFIFSRLRGNLGFNIRWVHLLIKVSYSTGENTVESIRVEMEGNCTLYEKDLNHQTCLSLNYCSYTGC